MNQKIWGIIFGVLAAFCWGIHAIISRYLTSSIPGINIAFFRFFIAATVIFVFLKISGKKIDFHIESKKWFWITVLLGLVSNFIFFHIGLEHTTSSTMMLLENTAPIFLIIFLIFIFKEKTKKIDLLAILITLVGAFLVFFSGKEFDILGGVNLIGNIFALLSGVTWAIFMLGSAKVFSQEKTTSKKMMNLFVIFFVSSLILSPFILFNSFALTLNDIFLLLLLGVIPTALAYILFYESASRISVVPAILLINLQIVFTLINSSIFLKEYISSNMIWGSILTILGVSLAAIKEKRLT